MTVNITVDEDLLHINWTEFQKHSVLNTSQQNNLAKWICHQRSPVRKRNCRSFCNPWRMARILGQVQTQLINSFVLLVGLINVVFSLPNYSQFTNGKWEITYPLHIKSKEKLKLNQDFLNQNSIFRSRTFSLFHVFL